MKGESASRMKGECKRNATAKARGQGGGGRGQRGKGEQPSQRRKRALAHKTTQQHETTLPSPRLFPFAPFGEGSDPLAPCPDSLPPASLLYRLHPLASPCIGLRPLASACIRLHLLHLPWSGGGVGWSGRCVGAPPAPAPCPCPKTKKAGYQRPCFLFIHYSIYNQRLQIE